MIAGLKTAVQRAIEAAKARGAKRAVLLPVSVPSHSSLMAGRGGPACRAARADADFACPTSPPVYTVDVQHARRVRMASADALKEQLFSPVRWADTVRAMIANGVQRPWSSAARARCCTALNRRVENASRISTMLAVDDPAIARSRARRPAGRSEMSRERRRAVVTGASRGIGRGDRRSSSAGAVRAIVGTATTEAGGAARSASTCLRAGLAGRGAVLDVAKRIRWRPASRSSTAQEGTPSILVNNAGVTRDGLADADERRRLAGRDRDRPDARSIATCKAVMRGMMKARYGRIVNIASVIGGDGQRGAEQLRCGQGRHDRFHQEPRARGRLAWHHGQRRGAGLHRDAT